MKIYGGRDIHDCKPKEMPNLFKDIETGKVKPAETKPFFETQAVKVSFSEEGLANARALMEYSKEYPVKGLDLQAQIEHHNKMLNTQFFETDDLCRQEMAAISKELRIKYNLPEKLESFEQNVQLSAKAYQILYDRIESEFNNPDRETTYLWDKEKQDFVEETKEDRIAGLNRAYNSYTDIIARLYKNHAQTQELVYGKRIADPDELERKVKQAYSEAIEDKNLRQFQEEKKNFKDYHLSTSVGNEWLAKMNKCNEWLIKKSNFMILM